jgi:hypothetical protein
VNAPEIDKLFARLRKAGHGSVIKFDASNSGQAVEGIIIDPGPQRPAGFESGVFITVPSDPDHIYYLDPDASKKEGRLIIQMLEVPKKEPVPEVRVEDLLSDFEQIRQAPDVKRGGGATGEACSKHTGIIELT